MGWMLAELFFCRVNGFGERLAHKRQADDDGKRPRGEAAARMSVSDRGEIAAGCKDIRKQAVWITLAAQRVREVHAHGGHAHHSAAAFAVVHGSRHPAAAGLQCREAGRSWRSAAEEVFLFERPAAFLGFPTIPPRTLLGRPPPRVK